MSAEDFTTKQVDYFCFVSGRCIFNLTDSKLHPVPEVFINNSRYSVLCPVVMEGVDSDVSLITEYFGERTLSESCTL